MAMMQYKDFVSNVNENPIKDQSDETVQGAVYDWFKYRYIGFEDTTKFLDILQRNVSINYPIYQQKLRIEPGVSTYDWLVSDYRERQLKSTGESNGKTVHGQDIVNTSENGTNSGTTTYNTSDINVKTGGHTETDTDGTHTTTVSPKVQVVTSEDGGDSAWSGDSQVSAVNPMSKSYDTFVTPSGASVEEDGERYQHAYQNMPTALNWDTVSNQAQSGHREYHDTDHKTTQSYIYGDGVDGDVTTTKGSVADPDTRQMVYNAETDTMTKTGTDSTAGTDTKTGTSTSTYGDIDTNGTDKRTDREQVTGRNEDPATLLARATAFIEQSSAFMWLKEQLDSCFYPGFYTEDEEGSANI